MATLTYLTHPHLNNSGNLVTEAITDFGNWFNNIYIDRETFWVNLRVDFTDSELNLFNQYANPRNHTIPISLLETIINTRVPGLLVAGTDYPMQLCYWSPVNNTTNSFVLKLYLNYFCASNITDPWLYLTLIIFSNLTLELGRYRKNNSRLRWYPSVYIAGPMDKSNPTQNDEINFTVDNTGAMISRASSIWWLMTIPNCEPTVGLYSPVLSTNDVISLPGGDSYNDTSWRAFVNPKMGCTYSSDILWNENSGIEVHTFGIPAKNYETVDSQDDFVNYTWSSFAQNCLITDFFNNRSLDTALNWNTPVIFYTSSLSDVLSNCARKNYPYVTPSSSYYTKEKYAFPVHIYPTFVYSIEINEDEIPDPADITLTANVTTPILASDEGALFKDNFYFNIDGFNANELIVSWGALSYDSTFGWVYANVKVTGKWGNLGLTGDVTARVGYKFDDDYVWILKTRDYSDVKTYSLAPPEPKAQIYYSATREELLPSVPLAGNILTLGKSPYDRLQYYMFDQPILEDSEKVKQLVNSYIGCDAAIIEVNDNFGDIWARFVAKLVNTDMKFEMYDLLDATHCTVTIDLVIDNIDEENARAYGEIINQLDYIKVYLSNSYFTDFSIKKVKYSADAVTIQIVKEYDTDC